MTLPIKYLVRKRALGDVLWIEPVIAALAHRNKKLIVHTRYNELFANYPLKNVTFKDKLNVLEKMFVRISFLPIVKRFFVNLDDEYEKNPHQHFLHAYQKKAGLPLSITYPVLYLSEQEKQMYAAYKNPGYIVLHTQNKAVKNFRKAHGIEWSRIVSYFLERGKKVFQIGVQDDVIPGAQYLSTSLREMIALIFNADCFIGVDSGPSHVAATLKTPSVLFFGSVNIDFRHFRELFNGFLLQEPCVFAGCFHDFRHPDEVVCRIVGDEGIPPCCKFNTNEVVECIHKLIWVSNGEKTIE